MSFWDRLTVVTFVLNPVLTAMCCCDGMKGGTLTLVYSLLRVLLYRVSNDLLHPHFIFHMFSRKSSHPSFAK